MDFSYTLQVARGTIPPAEAEERYYAMLAFPVSIMSQWWVRRSSSAAARICLICNRRSIDALADGADSADCACKSALRDGRGSHPRYHGRADHVERECFRPIARCCLSFKR